jgi:1-acyl-sn-glycerol-3-phosphate acyltransferase
VTGICRVAPLDRLDDERVGRPEAPVTSIKRRFSGRYPIDPFGLDPQLADLVAPAFTVALPVRVSGGEHVPEHGPATIVANRGFGFVEPAALCVAVQRVSGRRLRVIGAPSVPFLGALARRFGAIAASEPDITVALRAGHLVGVPLAHTFLRTGAGAPPHALMPALTHARIIPAAVMPGGPFGTAFGPWHVRFGPLVTLDDPYDPDDPLAAAHFADAMRVAVRTLLNET